MKLPKIKLTQLSKVELEERQMNALKGGLPVDPTCYCNCSKENSLNDTMKANAKAGYQYSYGGNGSYTGYVECGCLDPSYCPMANVRANSCN